MEIVLKAIIAALLTLAIERLPHALKAWKIRRKNFALLGDWYGYHLSFQNAKALVFSSEWHITKGILKPFHIECSVAGMLHYKGHVILEGDDRIIVYAHSLTQNEQVVYRFPNPLLSSSKLVSGLWLSYDHDKHIAAGGTLMSQQPLGEEQVLKEMGQLEVARFESKVVPLMRRSL